MRRRLASGVSRNGTRVGEKRGRGAELMDERRKREAKERHARGKKATEMKRGRSEIHRGRFGALVMTEEREKFQESFDGGQCGAINPGAAQGAGHKVGVDGCMLSAHPGFTVGTEQVLGRRHIFSIN